MRKVRAHLIVTLDGVVGFNAVVDTIARLREKEEVLAEFFAKVADEDAMLLGRVTYQEWAQYWPTSTNEPFASHITALQSTWSRDRWSPPLGDRAAVHRCSEAISLTQLRL